MKTKYLLSALLFGALSMTSCTNLDEELFDKVSMDDYGNPQWETYGEEEVVDFDDDPNDVPNDDLT